MNNLALKAALRKKQQGTLLNLLASSEAVTADSTKPITVDGVTMTVKQWFDQLNTDFSQLYTLAGL